MVGAAVAGVGLVDDVGVGVSSREGVEVSQVDTNHVNIEQERSIDDC